MTPISNNPKAHFLNDKPVNPTAAESITVPCWQDYFAIPNRSFFGDFGRSLETRRTPVQASEGGAVSRQLSDTTGSNRVVTPHSYMALRSSQTAAVLQPPAFTCAIPVLVVHTTYARGVT